jgi:hypothetical protein
MNTETSNHFGERARSLGYWRTLRRTIRRYQGHLSMDLSVPESNWSIPMCQWRLWYQVRRSPSDRASDTRQKRCTKATSWPGTGSCTRCVHFVHYSMSSSLCPLFNELKVPMDGALNRRGPVAILGNLSIDSSGTASAETCTRKSARPALGGPLTIPMNATSQRRERRNTRTVVPRRIPLTAKSRIHPCNVARCSHG